MKKSERAKIVKKILDRSYPDTPVPLDHKDNFTLLIAVLLSAQCTDERVNQITPKLFSIASSPLEMSKIPVNEIYKINSNEKFIKIVGGIKKLSQVIDLLDYGINCVGTSNFNDLFEEVKTFK